MIPLVSRSALLFLLIVSLLTAQTLTQAQSTPRPIVIAPKTKYAASPDVGSCRIGSFKATVLLSFDERGKVKEATIKQSTGNACADQAVLVAAKQYRYSPELIDGVPSPFNVTVQINSE